MTDKSYPHTGRFTQSSERNCKKDYNYSLCPHDSDYVEWEERENRPGASERTQVALIYIARPYLTAIDVTERRNLAYNFRSLLARDTKGHVTSGIYFPVVLDVNKPQEFTLFYQSPKEKTRVKMSFNKFRSSSKVSLFFYSFIYEKNPFARFFYNNFVHERKLKSNTKMFRKKTITPELNRVNKLCKPPLFEEVLKYSWE